MFHINVQMKNETKIMSLWAPVSDKHVSEFHDDQFLLLKL